MLRNQQFDAVLLADRVNIPAYRFPPSALVTPIQELQAKYKCFDIRDAQARGDGTQCRQKFKELIEDVLKHRLTYGFMHGQEDPFTGDRFSADPDDKGVTCGLTALIPVMALPDLKVWLGIEQVAPLLRSDLSSSEILMETWNVALTMVHKTIVSIY